MLRSRGNEVGECFIGVSLMPSVSVGIMPITVSWDDEQQSMIRWDFSGDWSWADSSSAADTTRKLLAATPEQSLIAILFDLATMQAIPRDSLRNMRQLLHGLRTQDIVIVCGDSVAVNVMIAFLRSIYRGDANHLYVATTLAAGRQMARQILGMVPPADTPTKPSRPDTLPPA